MKNSKSDAKIKGYLIGSGFDIMFNLPNWYQLVNSFSSFVIANANIKRNDALAKVEIINNMDNSPSRKMQSIKNTADSHISNKDLVDSFMVTSLKLDNHSYDHKLFEKAAKVFGEARDLVVTTNVSDVFLNMNMEPAFKRSSLSVGFYFPVHGSYFIPHKVDEAKPIMFEKDYQNSILYDKRLANLSEMLQNVEIIHVFGYSMNDVKILSRIVEATDTKVVYYYNYENKYWQEIIEAQFKSLFGAERISFVCEQNTSEGYRKNFDALLNSVEKQIFDEDLEELIEGLTD